MLLIPALLSNFRGLKDKTMVISFETNELTPEQLVQLSQNFQLFGYLAFKQDQFKSEQIKLLEEAKIDYEDKTKTPSKRLRDVLVVAFKQEPEGYTEFEAYYQSKMEKFINHIKNRLMP